MNPKRQRLKDQGLCIECEDPRGEDGTAMHCRTHADEHNRRNASRLAGRRSRWKRLGLCVECGDPTEGKGTLCKDHKITQRNADRRYRRKGAPAAEPSRAM